MPWNVNKDNRCPSHKPWAVTNANTGQLMGCHATQTDAHHQQQVLYATVPDSK